MNKAFFFDRDGIVNVRIPGDYVKTKEEFRFNEGFPELFAKIKAKGYLAVLITNQQGIGKGLMSESDLAVVHNYMQSLLKEASGYMFDDIYFCPDLESSNSPNRKPNPGMILSAIQKWKIDVSSSWMIGDSIKDYEAGMRAGAQTILIGDYSTEKTKDCNYIFRSINDLLNQIDKILG